MASAGKKLVVGGVVVAGVTGYMAFLGAQSSWQYYLTADECVANADELTGDRLRVSGRIVPGSLEVTVDQRRASFCLEGTEANLHVDCSGPLPDNLAEDIEVVVEGRLDNHGRLQADKVLTRCASKYQPQKSPPVSDGRAEEAP